MEICYLCYSLTAAFVLLGRSAMAEYTVVYPKFDGIVGANDRQDRGKACLINDTTNKYLVYGIRGPAFDDRVRSIVFFNHTWNSTAIVSMPLTVPTFFNP